jgi:hypothetical protein
LAFEVELFESLDAVEADAGGALDRGGQASLFDRIAWFRLVERHQPPAGKVLVARARDQEAAWLFLAVEGGTGRAFANWYSLRAGLIGAPAGAAAIGRTLRRRLARLELAPVEDPEPLAAGLREAGWRVTVSPANTNWQAQTAGLDFAAWWPTRPSRLRSTAARKAKAGFEIAIHRAFHPAAWAEYEAVYRASWKPEEGSFPFLRALAEQEGAAGALRLGIARKEGRPVAAQLWLVEGGTATIHKLAYVEDAKAMSPGTVLSMAMFRAALDEDHVACIDYGVGDEGYKADWMDASRPLWRIEAFNPSTLSGLAGIARAKASTLVRRWRSG